MLGSGVIPNGQSVQRWLEPTLERHSLIERDSFRLSAYNGVRSRSTTSEVDPLAFGKYHGEELRTAAVPFYSCIEAFVLGGG